MEEVWPAPSQAPAGSPLYAGFPDSLHGMALADKIASLADREEIRELIATYAHRMARGIAVAELFTDDGAYINRGTPNMAPREIRGREALDAYYGGRSGW